jgi:alpha-glucosidase
MGNAIPGRFTSEEPAGRGGAGVSRRSLLQGATVTAVGSAVAATGLLPGMAAARAETPARADAGGQGTADAMGGAVGVATSPGTRSRVGLLVGRDGLAWTVSYDGKTVLEPSPLGLTLASGTVLGPGARPRGVTRRSEDTSWEPVYGRRSSVRDAYEEVRLQLVDPASGSEFAVIARAYDEGVALRYELSGGAGQEIVLTGEETAFAFPADTQVFSARDEDAFLRSAPGDIPISGSASTDSGPLSDQPLLVTLPGGLVGCVCESARLHYPRMMLAANGGSPTTVRTHLMQYAGRGGTAPAAPAATLTTPFSTPWRVIMLGTRATELIDHSDLVTTLAPPSRVDDTSWIRPGKAIRVTTLTTAAGLACVDFAAQHGLHYIEFDAGWYGPETNPSSDPTRPIAALDLPQVIGYAASSNIGVILYVNRIALSDSASLFATYRQWGVAGLKLGFLLDGTQDQTDWLIAIAEQTAANKLLLNTHDDLRPFGQERTYPNWISMEGVRGNEHFPTATHNVTLPYGRNAAGPMDYTICLAQSRDQTTNAHQMAMAAVYYQPLAWLYWYDQPAKYATGSWPELPWFDAIPTTWDDSRALAGEIGEYAVVARRSGTTWYIGAMTNEQSRLLDLPLDFLGPGTWQATIYADGTSGDTANATPVVVSGQAVTAGSAMRMRLAPSGGQAVVLSPAS